jgi:hypothetical protein
MGAAGPHADTGHMTLRALLIAAVAVLAAAPAAASAADTTVAADAHAQQVAALDGTVVWVSGTFGHQSLMTVDAPGATPHPVPGVPEARSYRSLDLGRDVEGDLVLTYLQCSSPSRCVALRDDLGGHHAGIKGLRPKGCTWSAAPAIWRARMAYGLDCKSAKRTGLYVKKTGSSARKLPLPKDANRFGSRHIGYVDLRGTRVAAAAQDIYEYAFSETVNGTGIVSILAAASEGDSDEHIRGLSLGNGNALWTLVDSEHVGDPNQAVIHRVTASDCSSRELLANAPGPDEESGYRATGMAVDGDDAYLVVPGTGIVRHDFAPAQAC